MFILSLSVILRDKTPINGSILISTTEITTKTPPPKTIEIYNRKLIVI